MANIYGFSEEDIKRVAAAVREYEQGHRSTSRTPGRKAPMWPSPWDVGDGEEDVVIAPATNTSETADTDTWALGDGTFSVPTYRYTYDSTGDEILYGFVRTWRYDAYGRVVAISAETRFTVSTPDLCEVDE